MVISFSRREQQPIQQEVCQDLPLRIAIMTHEKRIISIHNCSDFDRNYSHHNHDDRRGVDYILSRDTVSIDFCSLIPFQIPSLPPPPSRDKNHEISSTGGINNVDDVYHIDHLSRPDEACCICGGGSSYTNDSNTWPQPQHRMLQTGTFFAPLITLLCTFIVTMILYTIYRLRQKINNEEEQGEGGGPDNDLFDDHQRDPSLFPEIRSSTNEEQLLADRRELIAKNIIHKVVVAKNEKEGTKDGDDDDEDYDVSDDDESVIFPHEKIMFKRELTGLSFQTPENEMLHDLSIVGDSDSNLISSTQSGYLYDLSGEDYLIAQKSDLYLFGGTSSMPSRESASSLYSPSTCPICIESFKKGEEIAWSFNEKCHHAFHLECISDWLMSHDECPMCRLDFLNIDASEEA